MVLQFTGEASPSSGYHSMVNAPSSINNGLRDVGMIHTRFECYANCMPVLEMKVEHRKILSVAARAAITAALDSGIYGDRADRLEPPYMAPSADPDDYPSVCISFPVSQPWG